MEGRVKLWVNSWRSLAGEKPDILQADISFVVTLDEDRLIVHDTKLDGSANSIEFGGQVETIQRQMFLTNDNMQFDRDNCACVQFRVQCGGCLA